MPVGVCQWVGVHEEGGEQQREREDAGVVGMIGTQGADAFSVDYKNVDRFSVFALAGYGLRPYPEALSACCTNAEQTACGALRVSRAALTIDGRPHGETISPVQ